MQIYHDYMAAFAAAMGSHLGTTITNIEVGMGPAGEMRYPAYQSNLWTFCGIGEFQCYGANVPHWRCRSSSPRQVRAGQPAASRHQLRTAQLGVGCRAHTT